MRLATVTPPAALAALQTVILIVLLLVAVAAFGPPAHGQELIREGCYGWLYHEPGSCGIGDSAMEWRVKLGGDLWWRWPWITPAGQCMALNEFLWERMVNRKLEHRCVYTDGRAPTGYYSFVPELGVNEGRCE